MDLPDNSELILALIKADMCHHKLIKGLEKAGLEVYDFYGDLDIQILKLMNLENEQKEDELHDFYYSNLEKLIADVPVEEFREYLVGLAEKMYGKLVKKKSDDL
jgi:hypothetical protein